MEQKKINIKLDKEQAEGTYSNAVIVSHSTSEFIMDFARIMPGTSEAKVYSRIVMTPQNTKMLLKTLQDNIKKFEEQFGEIKISKDTGQNIGFTP